MYYCEETQRHQQGDTFDDIAEWIRKSQDKEEKKRKSFFKFRGDRQMSLVYSTDSEEKQKIWNKNQLVNYSDKRTTKQKFISKQEKAYRQWVRKEQRQ